MNKVPTKKGYVPNKYTGRSIMMSGGIKRKEATMRLFDNKIKMDKRPNYGKPTMWNAVALFEKSKPSIFNQERSMYKRGGYMGGGTMVENMQADMKKKMYGGGSKIKYNKGGYASIADMEKQCGSKTVKNTMK